MNENEGDRIPAKQAHNTADLSVPNSFPVLSNRLQKSITLLQDQYRHIAEDLASLQGPTQGPSPHAFSNKLKKLNDHYEKASGLKNQLHTAEISRRKTQVKDFFETFFVAYPNMDFEAATAMLADGKSSADVFAFLAKQTGAKSID